MSTIKTTLKFTFATLVALYATTGTASAENASGWAVTPANVKAAQDLASIAKANYEHHLALINNESIRKDPAKFAEAAAAFEKSRQEYQRVVTIEKEQIAIAIQGGKPATTAAAPAPTAQQTTSKTPTLIAPELAPVKTPVSTGYREPQNVASPVLIAPQAAPTAEPVSTGYREPQNIATPAAPKPYAEPQRLATAKPESKTPTLIAPQLAPAGKPTSTGYREPQNIAKPTIIAPQAAPQAKPVSTGYREPQNVATPDVIAPQAAPQRIPSQTVPAKPEARRPVNLAAYQAPVGKEIAGTGYKGEILLTADNHHATAADVQIVAADKATTSAKATAAPTTTTSGSQPAQSGQLATAPNSTLVLKLNDETKRATGEEKRIEGLTSTNTSGINKLTATTTLLQRQTTKDLAAESFRAQVAETNNKNAITTESQRAAAAEQTNATAISDESQRATTAEQTNATAITAETKRATTAEAGLNAKALGNSQEIRRVSTEVQAQGVYVQRHDQVLGQHTTAIEQNRKGVAQNRQDIAQNRSAIKHNSARIDATNKRIDDLKADNRDVRREMKSIGNNAAAMSSLHFDGNRSSWALSTGSYNADGAAIAGGLQKGIGEHLAVTVQGSFDDSGNGMIGAGIHGDFE